MKLGERLRRLEAAEQGRWVYEQVVRIAQRHCRNPGEVLRRVQEIGQRIARWGVDSEIRRLARGYGKTEDEVRARFEAISEELLRA